MLVDLARNDVGRVVTFGTEVVDEMMVVERYSHIMHLTSQVSGRLAPGKGPIDVLRATLPAGTLSGAPKVRAMEIIDDLEPTKRGVYGGVVGYLDFSGNLDTAIAIRTMTVESRRPGLGAGRRGHRGRQRSGRRERRVRPQGGGHAVGGGHGPGRRRVGPSRRSADRSAGGEPVTGTGASAPGSRPVRRARAPRPAARSLARDVLSVSGPTPPRTSRASAARTWPALAVGDSAEALLLSPQGRSRPTCGSPGAADDAVPHRHRRRASGRWSRPGSSGSGCG